MNTQEENLHKLLDAHIKDIKDLFSLSISGVLPIPTGDDVSRKVSEAIVNPAAGFLSLFTTRGPLSRMAASVLKHESWGRSLISKGDLMLNLAEQTSYPKIEELKL
jgi:hypothetical protein